MLKIIIILRRTLAKQEVAERTPKRIEIRSICSSDLLPKYDLIKWLSMDLLVLWHWFCKIIFISFKTSTGKKVLGFAELINMFTYTKNHYLFYESIQSNRNMTQSDKKKLLFFSRFSQFKNFMGCLYLSLFQYGCCLKSIWNISVWNVR